MKSGVSILVVCLAMSGSPALGQSLPDIARQQGGSARRMIDLDGPIARPAELPAQSDLVIHGRVADVTVRLNSDQSDVVTDYTIVPIQAFTQRRIDSVASPGAISNIVVQQYGGSLVTADGLRLSTSVDIFRESERFRVGEEVVAFLIYRSELRVYYFSGGAFGAYRIRDGKVRPMTKEVATRLRTQPVDASSFFRDLQRPR